MRVGWRSIAFVCVGIVAIVEAAHQWAADHPGPPVHRPKSCVVLPLRGDGGMVTSCETLTANVPPSACVYGVTAAGQEGWTCTLTGGSPGIRAARP